MISQWLFKSFICKEVSLNVCVGSKVVEVGRKREVTSEGTQIFILDLRFDARE